MFPHVNHCFDLPIWKIHADTQAPNLLFELRDGENRALAYYRLQFQDFHLQKLDALGENAWWSGIYTYRQGIAWAYRYPDPERPESLGIWAWDTEKDQILWADPEARWGGFTKEGSLYDVSISPAMRFRIRNTERGETLKLIQQIPDIDSMEEARTELIFPQRYPVGHPYYEETCHFLDKKLNIRTSFPVDYVEVLDKIVISYFLKENSRFSNYLLILDTSAHVHLHKCIQNELLSFVSDTFFVYEKMLFFKAESNKIIAHNL